MRTPVSFKRVVIVFIGIGFGFQVGMNITTTETVDRLFWVTDKKHCVLLCVRIIINGTENIVLNRVRILKFIDQCSLVFLA